MTAIQIIGQVSRFGFAIVIENGQPRLKRTKGDKELPTDLLQKLKSRREEIIQWFLDGGEKKTPPEEQPPEEVTEAKQEEIKWYPLFGPDDDAAFESMKAWNRSVLARKSNGTDIHGNASTTRRNQKKGGRGETQKDELPGMG